MVLDIGVKVQPYGFYSFPYQNLSNPYVFTAFIIYIGYIDLLKPFISFHFVLIHYGEITPRNYANKKRGSR